MQLTKVTPVKSISSFSVVGTIQGNKVSTFDGLTYDLDSSCTYMLARDFVNSNFSVVLNKDGDNKTIIIVKGDTPIKLFSNGQVNKYYSY